MLLKQIIKKTVRHWYALFLPFLLQCTEPSIIGLDVQPVTDQINVKYVDSLQVNAYTLREDSVRSDRTLYYLLGSINDNVFGKSTASFATQLNLPSSNITFPQDATVDSIVLSLVVKGYYGNDKHINPLQIRVYEVDDMLYPDSSYYSMQTLNKKSLIGAKNCIPNLTDSVFVDNSKLPPHVRIPLDNNLAKRFIEDAAGGSLANNATFTEYFKGILVEVIPASIGGSIYYFDILSTASKVTLYYHTAEQSSSFSFLINDKCARFNMYTQDYTTANADFQSQLANQGQPSEKLYLQSRAGTKINISFPDIKNIIDPYPVIINKAELVFKVDAGDITSGIYPVPVRLTLVKYKEDGTYAFMADQASASFGGEYNSSKKEFKFNISQHIQSIIKEEAEDYGIALVVSGASTRGDRVVLHGMLSGENKPQLKLTYTIIN
jgi:hypothetical protein